MVEGSSPPARALLTGGSRPCDKSRYLLPAPPDICKRGERDAPPLARPLVVAWLASESLRGHTDPTTLSTGTPAAELRGQSSTIPQPRAREGSTQGSLLAARES